MWHKIRASLGTRLTAARARYSNHFARQQKLDQDLLFSLRGAARWPDFRQWRYLHKFYSEKEIVVTKIAIFAILLSSLSLSYTLYRDYLVTVPAAGGEYVEAVAGSPNYINPLYDSAAGVDQDLSKLIYSSLMRFSAQGELVPDLAESYTIDDKGTTYTFTLKSKIGWHDGAPLTAADVVFTIQSIKDPAFKSPLGGSFRGVNVKLIDDRTLSLTLTEPFAPFLSLLTFGILPEHLWQEIDPGHALLAELNLKPVGSGPYQFVSYSKDKKGNIHEYRLKRFRDYYQEGPFIEQITLKFFGSVTEAEDAVVSGNADGLGLLAANLNAGLALSSAKQIRRFSLPQYTALFFNQASNPALAERAVREALTLATSREQIIAAAWPESAEPSFGPLPNSLNQPADAPAALFDPTQAEKILDNANWKRPADEPEAPRVKAVKQGNKTETTPLEIKLTTVQKEENIRAAETIRELWQAIGVKVNLEIVESAAIQKSIINPRAYEILLFGQVLGRDVDPYPFWHSSQANEPGLNLALYSNKEADKLLEEGRRTTAAAVRAAKYADFEKKLLADLPAIFLYSLKFTYLLPADIRGIATESITQTADRFNGVNQWYIKTKKRIKL